MLYDNHFYVKSKKYNKLISKTKKKQAHRYREQTGFQHWGEGAGKGHVGVRGEGYCGIMWNHVWHFWKLWSTLEFKEPFIQYKKQTESKVQ